MPTEYGRARHAATLIHYQNRGFYWTRSPYYRITHALASFIGDGPLYGEFVSYGYIGVRAAIRVQIA